MHILSGRRNIKGHSTTLHKHCLLHNAWRILKKTKQHTSPLTQFLSECQRSQKTKDKNDEVVVCASRALTDVEKRYSQTEKEALAIIWGVEHFHLYLYGNEFTLVTDHKPLEMIYGSRKSKPSAPIERWVLRLQPCSFDVFYKPGSDNPADYLSR